MTWLWQRVWAGLIQNAKLKWGRARRYRNRSVCWNSMHGIRGKEKEKRRGGERKTRTGEERGRGGRKREEKKTKKKKEIERRTRAKK